MKTDPSNRILVWTGLLVGLILMAGCSTHRFVRPPPPEAGARPTERFENPLSGSRVISPFGPRNGRMHTGIDLKKSPKGGDPVRAARTGRVMRAERFSSYGLVVEIQHEDRFSTRYAHLKSIDVKKGQKVKGGATLGRVGQTGRATTPHLHFEILTPQFRFMDPATLIKFK